MAGFRYFLPNVNVPFGQAIHLPDERLRRIIGEKEFLGYGFFRGGPGGLDGTTVALAGESLAFEPDLQRWEPVHGTQNDGKQGVAYYVGMYTDERRPTPIDLERKQRLPGLEIAFRDDSVWLVPELHAPGGVSSIPQTVRYVSGQFVHSPDAKYEEICQRAADIYRRVFEITPGENSEAALAKIPGAEECFRFVADVLGVNYRVGPVECAMLEIFAFDFTWYMNQFLGAVFGLREILEGIKKKAASQVCENSNTDAGAPDSAALTSPASGT